MIFQCPSCGTWIEGVASSCPVCGRPFAQQAQAVPQLEPVPNPEPELEPELEPEQKPDSELFPPLSAMKQREPAPYSRQSQPVLLVEEPNSPSFYKTAGPRKTKAPPPVFHWWYILILLGFYTLGMLSGIFIADTPTVPTTPASSSALSSTSGTSSAVSSTPASEAQGQTSEGAALQSEPSEEPSESASSQASQSPASQSEKENTALYEITYQHCKIFWNSFGTLCCNSVIEILNTTKNDLYIQKATLDFEDQGGALLGTTDNIVCGPQIIRPGKKSYIFCNSVSIDGNLTPETDYVLAPYIKAERAANPIMRYDVSDLSISRDDDLGNITVIGKMTNSTGKGGGSVHGICIFYDEDKTPLGAYYTWLDALSSGESSSFQMPAYSLSDVNYADIKSYWVYIERVQYQ